MRVYFIAIFVMITLFACQQEQKSNVVKNNTEANKLNIAVFKGNGAGAVSVIETIEALRIDTGINAKSIDAVEIQSGELNKFDAIIFPGGSGSKQLLNLGESGQEIIRDFVINKGKGVIGICAGAYMLSSTPGYPNLKIASSIHIDRAHYNRGRGLVEFN